MIGAGQSVDFDDAGSVGLRLKSPKKGNRGLSRLGMRWTLWRKERDR